MLSLSPTLRAPTTAASKAYTAFLGHPAVGGPTVGKPSSVQKMPYAPAPAVKPSGTPSAGGYTRPTDPGAAAAPPPAPSSSFSEADLSSDPIVQRVRAQNSAYLSGVDAAALAQKKQAAIQYGDPTLARALLGDENTANAAAQNPDSTLKQRDRAQTGDRTNLREGHNKQNTFYSSAFGTDLTNLVDSYRALAAQDDQAIRDQFGGIDSQAAAAHRQAQADELAALEQAWQQAISSASSSSSGVGAPAAVSSGQPVMLPPPPPLPAPTSPMWALRQSYGSGGRGGV